MDDKKNILITLTNGSYLIKVAVRLDLDEDIMRYPRDISKRCLICDNEIQKGNYCKKHRWGDNEYLPKPNEGETVNKP